ncbi:MAG: MFS transporter [Candidatus Obscuribacter sp.]|nr:MFS transporter [Candidatus Obscuribacter sp.]
MVFHVKKGEPVVIPLATRSNTLFHLMLGTWLGMLFDGLDTTIFMLTMYPCLAELLKTDSYARVGEIGAIIMAVFMFGWALGAIGFGILADKYGRARMLALTVIVYGVFTGLCAFCHSWQELAVWRFFVGCGIGAEASLGGVLLAESLGRSDFRVRAVGILQSGFPVGVLLLALLNLLFGKLGWRFLYFLGIAPALLALYLRAFIEEPSDQEELRQSLRNIKCKAPHLRTPDESRLLTAPLVSLFDRSNRRALLVIMILAGTACIGTYGVLAWLPAWINQIVGTVAIRERSLALIAQNLGALCVPLVGGTIVKKCGRPFAFRASFIGALFACTTLFIFQKSFSYLTLIHIAMCGFFVCSAWTFLFIYVPELFEARIRATAFSFSIQSSRVLAGFSALFGGSLISAFMGQYAVAGASISLVYIIGLVATFFMPPTDGIVGDAKRVGLKTSETPVEAMQ